MLLMADLDRCVGCHACEIACKQLNETSEGGTSCIRVLKVGPDFVGEKLAMDFIPQVSDNCSACLQEVEDDSEPFCVSVCPTEALFFVDTADALEQLRSGRRVQILNFIEKKEMRDTVVY